MVSYTSTLKNGRISFLLIVLLLLNGVVFGQKNEVERITKTLCSPEFHGRGYVNKGDSLAAEFIAAEFKKIGLKPLKKSYFQSFKLDVNTFPNEMSIQHNGRTLTPGVHYLVDPASAGGKLELHPKLIPIETALNVEKLIEEIKSISNGKEYNAIALNFVNLSADTLKKVAGLKEELAGMMPVIEITNQKFSWSVSDQQLKNPLIQIQDSIFSKTSSFTISIDAQLVKDYTSRNVFAYLPAKKKSKKTVVYTAHYDHLGRMGAETYFPGANDNASGTAMLLSMAKYFKENPVDYNILFIAFAGEEAGLLGSKHFVEHPLVKLNKISFLLNLDIMGSGEDGITVVNATLFENEFKQLQAINAEKNLLKQVKSRGPAANSDHYWFTQMGVPAFFIYTMGPNKNYHDVFDTQANLSFVEYEDITTLLVEFTKHLKR